MAIEKKPKKTKQPKQPEKMTYLTDVSSEYINKTSLEYSMYTLERALVGIDGLKSSQRKAIYALSKVNGKIKTMSLSGKMIEMEIYVHGDSSASTTISNMATTVSNNYPLIEGIGSFGTNASPDPAAARYTYVKKSRNTEELILPDANIIPMRDNYDGSTKEPKFYLPLVPLAFLGTTGMSVGYKPNILPRNMNDVIDNCIAYINKKEMKFMVPYYKCYGAQEYAEHVEGSKFIIYGKAVIEDSSTVTITGLPPNKSREKLVERLIQLQENGTIRDYDDSSTDNISISIKLPRGQAANWSEKDALEFFGLQSKVTEAIIVITELGGVKVYNDPNDLIKDFVDFRFKYYVKRYEKLLGDASYDLSYKLLIKKCFENEISSKIKKFKNKAEVTDFVKSLNKDLNASNANIETIVSFPAYRWCSEYFDVLNGEIDSLVTDIESYEKMLANKDLIWNVYKDELKKLKSNKF